jgi:hypothetical protein
MSTGEPLSTSTSVPTRAALPSATGLSSSPTHTDEAPPTQAPTAEVGAAALTPTADAGNAAELADIIRVTAPEPGQIVASPLVIRGEARGMWFFEASFPIRLEDGAGGTLATSIATALGEWMTEDFVPFEAVLTFAAPAGTGDGRLVLQKDNPSGLPEHDAQLVVPVRLAP